MSSLIAWLLIYGAHVVDQENSHKLLSDLHIRDVAHDPPPKSIHVIEKCPPPEGFPNRGECSSSTHCRYDGDHKASTPPCTCFCKASLGDPAELVLLQEGTGSCVSHS